MAWLCIAGFFRGIALSNFTLTVSEYSSLEKLPAAFGWHMVGKAIFVIIFGPLIGAIRDMTGSFPICIHSQSICILVCIFAWSVEFIMKYLKRNEQKKIPIAIITAWTCPTSCNRWIDFNFYKTVKLLLLIFLINFDKKYLNLDFNLPLIDFKVQKGLYFSVRSKIF